MKKICIKCYDTGKYLGNGMVMTNCDLCDDDYVPPKVKAAPALDKIDRRSKSYQKAIKDIMAINPDIERNEAIKMFDNAYVKN